MTSVPVDRAQAWLWLVAGQRQAGSDPPQRVAEAVLRFVSSHLEPTDLPDQFDASLIRRRFPDAEIPKLLER